jgi:hypothetical protein
VAARQASLTAYQGESASQALATGEQAFGSQIGASAFKALAMGPQGQASVVQKLSANEALVQDPGGRQALAVGALPLYGVKADGSPAPEDLSLVDQGGSLGPTAPLVPVSIPKSATGSVVFSGVGFDERFGSAGPVAGEQAGDGVFFANVATDTDAIVRPVSVGAEVSWLLRSPSSPSSETLTFGLPGGWTLRSAADGSGDVELVDASGARQATMLAPVGSDAQGQPVPCSYKVTGPGSLTVSVALSGGDFAYPILVDPVTDVWSGTQVMWTCLGSTECRWWLSS